MSFDGRHLRDRALDPSKPAPDRFWFTSDSHFRHARSLEFEGRGAFGSVREMDEAMVEAWNAVVGENDVVYHLGDFAFGDASCVTEAARAVKGRIVLIEGNHDTPFKMATIGWRFEAVRQIHNVEVLDPRAYRQRRGLVLAHYPIECWAGRYKRRTWHLHGHVHATMPLNSAAGRLNLSVEHTGFAPVDYDWVAERIVDEVPASAED